MFFDAIVSPKDYGTAPARQESRTPRFSITALLNHSITQSLIH
jgi:hypothetical protein